MISLDHQNERKLYEKLHLYNLNKDNYRAVKNGVYQSYAEIENMLPGNNDSDSVDSLYKFERFDDVIKALFVLNNDNYLYILHKDPYYHCCDCDPKILVFDFDKIIVRQQRKRRRRRKRRKQFFIMFSQLVKIPHIIDKILAFTDLETCIIWEKEHLLYLFDNEYFKFVNYVAKHDKEEFYWQHFAGDQHEQVFLYCVEYNRHGFKRSIANKYHHGDMNEAYKHAAEMCMLHYDDESFALLLDQPDWQWNAQNMQEMIRLFQHFNHKNDGIKIYDLNLNHDLNDDFNESLQKIDKRLS